VFDAASIEALIERLRRVLVAMTAIRGSSHPRRTSLGGCRSICLMRVSAPAWMGGVIGRC
jgi:hypothetical protein